MLQYDVVLLAGGSTRELYPLTSAGVPKSLLPVANNALLSYSLRQIEASGGARALFVVRLHQPACRPPPISAALSCCTRFACLHLATHTLSLISLAAVPMRQHEQPPAQHTALCLT